MKRFILALFMLICSLASVTVSTAAADKTYYSGEADMAVTFPENYIVLTRNIQADDPIFDRLTMTKDALIAHMENKNLAMIAYPESEAQSLYLTVTDSFFTDFAALDEDTADAFYDAVTASYTDAGYIVLQSGTFTFDETLWVKYNLRSAAGHMLEYRTIVNGKHISVLLTSANSAIPTEIASETDEIVNSIRFSANAPETQPTAAPIVTTKAPSPAFIYTDEQCGITFTVPKGWIKADDRGEHTAAFRSEREYAVITYVCTDISGQAENQTMEPFTAQHCAALFGCSESDVKTVTYGGTSYFRIKDSTDSINCIRAEQDKLYLFRLSGTDEAQTHEAFEKLLASVMYPEPDAVPMTETSAPIISGGIILAAALAALILLALTLALRTAAKSKAHNK